ncbi:hypothetical protein HKX48_008445 [Thoreauomyces humboldtii]|nr:hypothetical protein HKX48_008445 [Thoreauomyces humboldtii]
MIRDTSQSSDTQDVLPNPILSVSDVQPSPRNVGFAPALPTSTFISTSGTDPSPQPLPPMSSPTSSADVSPSPRKPVPKGTLASRLRSSTISGVRTEPKPDAFMTVVHSARVMNTATTEKTALSKAAFYDRMLEVLEDGRDEAVALAEGVKKAREVEGDVKASRAAAAAATAATASTGVSIHPVLPVTTPVTTTTTAASPIIAGMTAPGLAPSGSNDSLSDDSQAGMTGRTKLKGIFTKMIKPSISFHTDDSLIDSNSAGGQGTSMAHLRVLHRKLCMTVEDYDTKTIKTALERERSIIAASKLAVTKAEEETRKAVTAEYEPRIKHDKCNARISLLERENRIMMGETNRTIALNKELTTEVTTLRLINSTADSERVLMVSELARRRLQTRAMHDRLAVAVARIAELEGVAVAAEMSSVPAGEDPEGGEEDWEDWCRNKDFSRASWNKSTTTTLLSQKAPASVIHIGDVELESDDGLLNYSPTMKNQQPAGGIVAVVSQENKAKASRISDVVDKRGQRTVASSRN